MSRPDLIIILTDEERAAPSYENHEIRAWRNEHLPARAAPHACFGFPPTSSSRSLISNTAPRTYTTLPPLRALSQFCMAVAVPNRSFAVQAERCFFRILARRKRRRRLWTCFVSPVAMRLWSQDA